MRHEIINDTAIQDEGVQAPDFPANTEYWGKFPTVSVLNAHTLSGIRRTSSPILSIPLCEGR